LGSPFEIDTANCRSDGRTDRNQPYIQPIPAKSKVSATDLDSEIAESKYDRRPADVVVSAGSANGRARCDHCP